MNPPSHSNTNKKFQCPQYSPISVYNKHCKFYNDTNCKRTGDRCAEWLRSNSNNRIETETEHADVDLFGYPISESQFRATRTPSQSPATKKTMPTAPQWETQKQKPLGGFSKELIESFKRLQTEIHFTSDTGEFWLVPEYRDRSRGEITPEHLALICNVLTAFPGATVVAFETISKNKGENSHD